MYPCFLLLNSELALLQFCLPIHTIPNERSGLRLLHWKALCYQLRQVWNMHFYRTSKFYGSTYSSTYWGTYGTTYDSVYDTAYYLEELALLSDKLTYTLTSYIDLYYDATFQKRKGVEKAGNNMEKPPSFLWDNTIIVPESIAYFPLPSPLLHILLKKTSKSKTKFGRFFCISVYVNNTK